MSRARELADFANNTAGLETVTVSDVTDLSVSASNINSATNQITDSSTDLNVDSNTLVVDKSENKVGIGITPTEGKLHVKEDHNTNDVELLTLENSTTSGKATITLKTTSTDTTKSAQIKAERVGSSGETDLEFHTFNGSSTAERMRIDSSGDIGIGTDSPNGKMEIKGGTTAGTSYDTLVLRGGVSPTSGSGAKLYLSGSTAPLIRTAYIEGVNTGGSGNGHSLIFATSANSGNPAERMRIDSTGTQFYKSDKANSTQGCYFNSGGQLNIVTNGSTESQCIFINRISNDGTLILFRQSNNTEGSISVSGSTVSYNGGHLSRWSQLPDNSRDNSLLKGTVMTNLDQMAVWSHDAVEAIEAQDAVFDDEGNLVTEAVQGVKAQDAYTEENEQLNCMAISTVEGDPNVAGVFVNWDEDDDDFHNDMNIAMTGDMVIRIAQGVTVEKGQLLMSAGDGTAKPQGDDIVKNKTIAKVTSNHVSHTYDDGSYCVPCVLMAC